MALITCEHVCLGYDGQTVLELVLRGATKETAGRFSAAVRKAVDGILTEGIPQLSLIHI